MGKKKSADVYMPANMAYQVFGFATYRQFGLYVDRHKVRQQKDGRRRWIHVADLAWTMANSPPRRRASWPIGQTKKGPTRLGELRAELADANRRASALTQEHLATTHKLTEAKDRLQQERRQHEQKVCRFKDDIASQKRMLRRRPQKD